MLEQPRQTLMLNVGLKPHTLQQNKSQTVKQKAPQVGWTLQVLEAMETGQPAQQ